MNTVKKREALINLRHGILLLKGTIDADILEELEKESPEKWSDEKVKQVWRSLYPQKKEVNFINLN